MLREEELRRLASAHVLWKGCADLRLDDVVAACGVSRGTSYLHFPSRSSLIVAALAHMDGALAARLTILPAEAGTPREALRWIIRQAVKAQVHTLSISDGRALPDGGTVEGQAWPCCLRACPCPYRGGVRSLERIADRARTARPARRGPVLPERLALLIVYLAPRLLVREKSLGGGSRQPPRIEPVVDYLIDRLILS